jgi:hypothetical protein
MSQVLVWKSDADGKIFEDKTEYTKHLRWLARQRNQARKITQMEADRESFIKRMGATVTSIKELEEFIADNWQWFFANGMKHKLWMSDPKPKNKHTLVSVRFENMRWSDSVSNTHSCPRDGVQNWDQRRNREAGKNIPEGYPGWAGHIYFTVNAGTTAHKVPRECDGYGSDYFKDTGINTGTGSGGSTCQYDMKLFASDFPAMAEMRSKMQMWAILDDKRPAPEFA